VRVEAAGNTSRSTLSAVGRHSLIVFALGCVIAVLVAACAGLAWPDGSMVAAQPGNSLTDDLSALRLFGLAQGLAFAAYTAALFVLRRRAAPLRWVLGLALLIQVIPIAAPLMLSTDVWGYWSYGRIAAFHGNPYEDAQDAFPADAAYAWTNPQWRSDTTAYGPVFVLGATSIATVVGDDGHLAAKVYQAIAAALMVAIVLMVAKLAPRAAFAVAFVGWNPLLAIQFAGSGHNDVLMVALALLAISLGMAGRAHSAGVAWALSSMVKWTSLVVLPLQVLADRAAGRRSVVPGFVVGGLVLAGMATLLYATVWPDYVLRVLHTATSNLSISVWPRLLSFLPGPMPALLPLLAFGAVYLLLLRIAHRGRARRGLASGLFIAASPFLWTWYLIMPVVLSAVDDDGPALIVAFGLCAYGLLYLGDAGSVFRVF
jgi:hypothetical protein